MKNYIQEKTRYLKAMMLTLAVGLFAFNGYAQSITASIGSDPGPYYAGESETVTYNATGFDAGTTFILWSDGNLNNRIDAGEEVFGTSQAQGAAEEIDFTWPDNDFYLRLVGFSGDTYLEDTDNFSVPSSEISVVGTNSPNLPYNFNRASARRATTIAYDFSTTAPIRIDVSITSAGLDATNPVEVLYSTDGFATSTVIDDVNDDTEFTATGTYTFELPSLAKTATTSIRVRQKGTVDYGTTKSWNLTGIQATIGEEYTFINPPGYAINQLINIQNPFIAINDAQDADDVPAASFYPGDEVNLFIELQNVDLTDKKFVATVENTSIGEEYVLTNQSVVDNGGGLLTLTGFIPLDIEYNNNPGGWDFIVRAFEGASPRFGLNESASFAFGLDDRYEVSGGNEVLFSGLVFDEMAERSVLTPEFNVTSTDGVLTLNIARKNNVVSPAGTDIVVEFTTDGTNFTPLTTLELNNLPFQGNGFATIEYDSWPTGVVSATTQFRIRQEGNNGPNLDAWILQDLSIINDSNIIPNSTIDEGTYNTSIFSPVVTINTIDVGGDGLAYPMEVYDFTFTIDEGAFPAGTGATVYFDRNGGAVDPDQDVIVGSIADITTETVSFTVPPIQAGDYTLYMVSSNGQTYQGATLAVYDLELAIEEITYENPVTIAEDEFGTPGSGITVAYTLLGDPGSSAELMLSVYDDNEGEYVMIGATSTVTNSGTITATLPSNIDYGSNPELQLTLGNGGVYSTSPFDENFFNQGLQGANIPSEVFESTVGTSDFGYVDQFTSTGVRSATTVPIDMSYGGYVYFLMDNYFFGSFSGAFDVKLEYSSNGTDWSEVARDEISFSDDDASLIYVLNNDEWSSTAQFRMIYNEDGAFAQNENTVGFRIVQIQTPIFLESTAVTANFNLNRPSLSVNDYDKTSFALGEEVTINYNAIGFPAGTEFAAVVVQADEFVVVGKSAAQGSASISATMPVVLPISENNPGANYDLYIAPYTPATTGGDVLIGEFINLEVAEDFLIVQGDTDPNDFENFYFYENGNRELLTREFDFTDAESVTLSFDYYLDEGTFSATDNLLTIPRLQYSIDGGATFVDMPAYELAEGEMQMFADGLLYRDEDVSIDIPTAAITSATHFRWYQPLNLGSGEDGWDVESIEIEINRGNLVPDYLFTTTSNNPLFNISLNAPNLADYTWVQSDLQDAVFNGETLNYSWNIREGLAPENVDAFPAGSTFEFYLYEGGDYVINPETGLPYIIGSTDALGDDFTADIPFFVVNENYDVRLAASVMQTIDGVEEKVYYIGDEESGSYVGSLDVFLRVAQLEYLGDPNATIYAGQDVTFAITLENDETNLAANTDIFANIIFDDVLIAAQQGLGDITFALPTDAVGNLDFDLQLSEGAPIGEVGEELMSSDYNNLEDDQANFTSDLNELVYINTSDIYESQLNYYTSAFFYYTLNFEQTSGQRLVLEYSVNGAPYVVSRYFNSSTVTTTTTTLPANMRTGTTPNNRITYRFRLEDDIADGSEFSVSNTQFYNGSNYIQRNSFVSYSEIQSSFVGNSGRRLITTRDFSGEELADAEYLSFNVDFDQLPAELTTSQYVKFEFSTDNGASYTELDSYPEMDADVTLSGDMFNYAITEAMKADGVRFRWRQEEAKGYFQVYNIDFNFGESIPFDYNNSDIDVVRQSLLLTSLPATEGCLEGDITVDYEIRGRFGADNVVMVTYKDENNNTSTIAGYEFNLVEGTGDVTFAMPSDALTAGDNNERFRFRLSAYDETTDNDFTVNGPYSEESYELVAPIYTDAEFGFNTPLACESEEVIVELYDEQDYFMYEVINVVDGTVLGSLTYDPETGDNEINIGAITTLTTLGLRITSMTEAGTVCNTITSSFEDDVEVQEMHMLYSNNGGANNYYRLATAGETITVCNNNGANILSAQRLQADGSITTGGADIVEWFRDNINNPVEIGSYLQDSDVTESGLYFARITTGSCVYTTESVQVNVVETPNKPTIAVTNGDLVDCSGADPVVLTAPAGFAYYLWSTGETTQSISIDDTRQVTLRVSNAPFGGGCGSITSAPVQVDRNDLPDFGVRNTNTNEFIGAGEEITICEGFDVRFYDGNSATNNGNITVVKDGADYATVESGNQFFLIEESGVYSFVWNFDNLNVTCSIESNEFTVNVVDAPTASPAITATGDLTFCAGEGTVTLTAPEGFDYYRWYRSGTPVTNPVQGIPNANVLEVSTAGAYTVQVGNAVGCYSPESNAITVNVVAEPSISTFNQISTLCGSGNVEFNVYNPNSSSMIFQLINGKTGLASGSPVTVGRQENGTLISDVVTENGTPFYLEVSYADGTGCTYSDPSNERTTTVNSVTLTIDGATLTAEYGNNIGSSEIRWYRNGTLLRNATGNSITITDAAEYTVEVEYGNGCIVTASSADLGRVLSSRTGASMDVSTYPNPTASDVTVSIASEYMGLHNVIITTLTGQVMKTASFEKSSFESKYEISVADLQSGMYNMQIQHEGLVKNIRIIKK